MAEAELDIFEDTTGFSGPGIYDPSTILDGGNELIFRPFRPITDITYDMYKDSLLQGANADKIDDVELIDDFDDTEFARSFVGVGIVVRN